MLVWLLTSSLTFLGKCLTWSCLSLWNLILASWILRLISSSGSSSQNRSVDAVAWSTWWLPATPTPPTPPFQKAFESLSLYLKHGCASLANTDLAVSVVIVPRGENIAWQGWTDVIITYCYSAQLCDENRTRIGSVKKLKFKKRATVNGFFSMNN